MVAAGGALAEVAIARRFHGRHHRVIAAALCVKRDKTCWLVGWPRFVEKEEEILPMQRVKSLTRAALVMT